MGSNSNDYGPDQTAPSAQLPRSDEERPVSTVRIGQSTQPGAPAPGEPHPPSEPRPPSERRHGTWPAPSATKSATIADIQSLPRKGEPTARYQELREIATSSTAVVSEAFDWQIRRRVALKRLRADLVDSEMAARFRRERLIASWLDHPNILPVYDFIDSDTRPPALIMKFIQGRTLARAIQDNSGDLTSIYQLLAALLKIADAMEFAHQAGIVHGDLKPQNIMVGTTGEAYVVDWGIARFQPEVERALADLLKEANIPLEAESTAGIFGTPAYMAPEQVQGSLDAIDPRTDVFGLGATLYQILTGAPLYEGVHVAAVLEKARRAEVIAPRKRDASRPIRPDLDALCMRALARRPEERFQTAGQFAEALRTTMISGSWFELRSYQAGDVIVQQGDPSTEAFLIERGECKVIQQSPIGDEVFLRILGAGDAFGEMGVFIDSPRTASVVALGDVQVQCIDRQSLQWAMDGGGPLGVLVRALANRFIEREQELYSLVPSSK